MKKYLILMAIVLTFVLSQTCMASDEQEHEYLVQIINQLEAIKPEIIAAEKQQPKENRVKFHYMSYRDSSGKVRNGLLEDINVIESGVKEKLATVTITQHYVQPVNGDYIQHKYKGTLS